MEEDAKGPLEMESCPLELKSFEPPMDSPNLAPYTRELMKKDPMDVNESPTVMQLQNLKNELMGIHDANTERLKNITDEWKKADFCIKKRQKEAPKESPERRTSTIKLDLKILKQFSEASNFDENSESSQGNARRRSNASPQSRRKKRSITSDSEYDGKIFDETESLDGSPVHQKKKQRGRRRDSSSTNRSSAEPSSNPPQDEVKIRPSQQTPNITFWNYVDAFFRPITEADMELLEKSGLDDPMPYIIPPLGRHYKEVWEEEEKSLLPSSKPNSSAKISDQKKTPSPAKGTINQAASTIENQGIELESDYYCGPLTERILSALMEENILPPDDLGISDTDSQSASVDDSISPQNITKEEIFDVEERIKRELCFIGLLDENDLSSKSDEDEISIELRRLQNHLRKVVEINDRRKDIVKNFAIERMAFQEYNLVLEEINKQVEQAFQKRLKQTQKRGKKKVLPKSRPEGVQILLDRRKRLIETFKPIFPSEKFASTTISIFDEPEEFKFIESVSLTKRS